MPKPFLKWAGGKRQLLPVLEPRLPKALGEGRVRTYCEPFLGGGALFFRLAERGFTFERTLLCDANPELTLVYRVVKTRVEPLITCLQTLAAAHLALAPSERKAHFLRQRETFNGERPEAAFRKLGDEAVRRAALFLFLNRTGFNGLWRVNASGEYNVPFGRYANPTICDARNLRDASKALRRMRAKVMTGDFTLIGAALGRETLVYYDPPYRPVSRSAAFNAYTAGGFSDAEQERLAAFYLRAHRRGTLQMLSNSASADGFFERLYRHPGLHLAHVEARRNINSRVTSRGPVAELVVTNYGQ